MNTQATSLVLGFAVLMCGSISAQQSSRYGGAGGDHDYRIAVPSNARITEIFGRAGSNVDQIGFRFLSRDNHAGSVSAGGTGGTYWSFPLNKGEYIREVYIRYAKRIDYMEFTTSQNRRKGLGGTGGERDVRVSLSGKAISGFYGRYGRVLDSLGVLFRSPYVYEPDPPHSLQAHATSTTSILLQWQDASNNEDGFEVERSEDGATYQPIATLGRDRTSYPDSGLKPSTTYWYRVRAFNSGGASAWSNVAVVKTQSPTPPFKFTTMLSGCTRLTLAGSDKVTGNTHQLKLALLGGLKDEPIAWLLGQPIPPIGIPGSSCSLLVAPLAVPVTVSTGFIDEMVFTVSNPPKGFGAAVQVLRLLDPLKPTRTIDASNGLRF